MQIKYSPEIAFKNNLLTALSQNRQEKITRAEKNSLTNEIDSENKNKNKNVQKKTDKTKLHQIISTVGIILAISTLTYLLLRKRLNPASKTPKKEPNPIYIPKGDTSSEITVKTEKVNTTIEKTAPSKPLDSENVNLAEVFKKNDFTKTVKIDDKNGAQKYVFAANIYKILKANTPSIELLGSKFDPKGFKITTTGPLNDLKDDVEFYQKISEDFAADALLANTNVLQSCKLNKDGSIVRLIFSDILGINSNGQKRHFGAVVDEISDFFNAEKYPDNAKVYSQMNRKNLIDSLTKILSLSRKELENKSVLNNYSKELNESLYIDTLLRRKRFLEMFLKQAKATEQKCLTIKDYAEAVKVQTIKEYLKNIQSYRAMNDIHHSIEKLPDKAIKDELTSLYNSRLKELTPKSNNSITIYEVEKLLDKYTYYHECTPEELEQLKKLYGNYAKDIKSAINSNLEALDYQKIKDITKIINKNNGKYIDFWQQHPDKTAIYINSKTTTAGQIELFSEEIWDFIVKNYKHFCEHKFDNEAIKAIIDYSGMSGYDRFNSFLRANYSIDKLIQSLNKQSDFSEQIFVQFKNKIDNLESILKRFFVGKNFDEATNNREHLLNKLNELKNLPINENNKQILINKLVEIKEFLNKLSFEHEIEKNIEAIKKYAVLVDNEDKSITLLRTATTDELEDVVFENGESLLSLIDSGIKDNLTIENIKTRIEKENPIMTQSGFLSTSIAPYKTLAGNVQWILKMDEGVKYNYLSDISHIFDYTNGGTEAEVLINPAHKIRINNAQYQNGVWRFFGNILPN